MELCFSVSTAAPRVVLFNKMDLSDLTETEIEVLEQKEMELGAAAVLFGSANTKGCGELCKSHYIPSVYEKTAKIIRYHSFNA